MTGDTALNSILEADTQTSEAAQSAPAVEAVAEPSVEKGVTGTEPPSDAQPQNDAPLVPRRALEDERRKRQDYERKLGDLEQKFNQLLQQGQQQAQQPKEPAPAPQIWDDPDGWAAQQQHVMQVQLYETRVALGRELLRSQKPDFDDAVGSFVEYARGDKQAQAALLHHPNPAQFAYQQGRRLRFLSQVGDDPEAYLERQKQEWLAQQQSAPAMQQQTSAPRASAPAPKSLAGTPSASQPRDASGRFAGPASLSDILGG